MNGNRDWRRRVEAIRLAGLDYVTKDRLAPTPSIDRVEPVRPEALSPATPTPIHESPAPPNLGHDSMTSLPTEPSMSPAKKSAELKALASEVAGCASCSALVANRSRTVFSDGAPTAELCFVGEAPGADEDAAGVPFVGKAGQLLTKIIEACKLKREEVYICNVLKCRPPDNRNPQPDEIENCRPFLERQLAIVQPKMMVALGKFAAAHLLRQPPEKVFITKIRGQVREYCGIPFMITLHPAYLLRNPAAKREVWEDMQEVMRRLGRPIE